uniref:Uncharacterized protein n=1 Tax=Manihot esculenta TaxID=3983 RepID=A0A251L9H5_MANES
MVSASSVDPNFRFCPMLENQALYRENRLILLRGSSRLRVEELQRKVELGKLSDWSDI